MSKERILIVDDEKNIANSLNDILSDEGYDVEVAYDGLIALEMIQSDPPDLVLLDIWLPGMDGIEVLKTVKTYHPDVEILIMSGHGTIDTAVKATKLGAFDFIEKPFSLDHLTQSVESVFKSRKTRPRNNKGGSLKKLELPVCFEIMLGMKKAIKNASRTNKPLLLLGEKGTGKEFIAQTIHRQSRKSNHSFIKLGCTVRRMPDIQSHLFSRRKGSLSSEKRSTRSRRGEEKVIYLTHIEKLSKGLQDKLAAALKNESSRKQESAPEFLPVRLFVSSSKDLKALAAKGQFNPDLLDVFKDSTLEIPPLRDHAANIPIMVKEYLEESARKGDIPVLQIGDDAMEALCNYNWPGNVKELRGVLDQILFAGSPNRPISLNELPTEIKTSKVQFKFNEIESPNDLEFIWEKQFIVQHLKKNDWNVDRTCKALKVNPKQFEEKLRRHSIKLPKNPSKNQGGKPPYRVQRTLKRSVVLCGSSLHSGIKTGLILQPLPPGSGIIFGDISSGQVIPARLEHVESTNYSTCLKKGLATVGTIEHIMAVLHMYQITNLLIKIGDEAPVMDGSAKDFCGLIEDGEFEEQDDLYDEIVIDKTYTFGPKEEGGAFISIEPSSKFKVSYHMEYPEPIGIQDYTYEFTGEESFKKEIAPARTFGFLEDVAQLTKMGFASGGKLDNFILLGDKKVLNTKLRFKDEFVRHKILDILGDFYLLGRPLLGHIKAHKSGHTQNIGLLKQIQKDLVAIH